MIDLQLTENEVHSIVLALKAERDQCATDVSSTRLEIVRKLSQRVVDENNALIEKLEAQVGEGVPF